jgi:hypothetical protein
MNRPLVIGGTLAIVVGAVWFLQGIGVLGGSGMSGSSFWGFVGLVLVGAGGSAVFRGRRPGETD